MQASNFGGTFDQLFLWIFYKIFTEDASLFLYTMVQKSQKWRKTQIKGASSIHGHRNLNYTERSAIARHRNFNAPKICKITVTDFKLSLNTSRQLF